MLGYFATARLRGGGECRQGWIINMYPLQIQGMDGDVYYCEGDPVIVSRTLPGTPKYKFREELESERK